MIMQTDIGVTVMIYIYVVPGISAKVLMKAPNYVIYVELYAFFWAACLWLMTTRCWPVYNLA